MYLYIEIFIYFDLMLSVSVLSRVSESFSTTDVMCSGLISIINILLAFCLLLVIFIKRFGDVDVWRLQADGGKHSSSISDDRI